MAGAMKRVRITEAAHAAMLARVDWTRLDAMSAEAVDAARRADPDAVPPMDDAAKGAAARRARMATGLTQAVFSARYGIPLGTLRDWEQGAATPDATARAYLRVIAREPEVVARALA